MDHRYDSTVTECVFTFDHGLGRLQVIVEASTQDGDFARELIPTLRETNNAPSVGLFGLMQGST